MCCEDIVPDNWWENIRVGDVVTSFIDEATALEFLAKGLDGVSEASKPMYKALAERRELALR